MLAACIFYATLQSPIYGALFGLPSDELSHVRLALAFGKALLGAIFYWLFLEQATSYGRMNIPLQPGPEFDWRAFARRGGGPLALAILIAVVAFKFSPDQAPSSIAQTIVGLSTKLLSYSALLVWLYSLLAPKLIRARFTVNSAIETEPGDKIYLTGNCRELGDWWPSEIRAISMDGTKAPTWTVEVDVPAKRELQFKFVRVRADGLTWEGEGHTNNHKDTVRAEGSTLARDWRR